MPDVTKDQFDTAARKVMSSAPAGLSRDQFFDMIDREIMGNPDSTTTMPTGTQIGDAKSGATPQPTDADPSTGGFFRNVAKSAIETVGGIGEGLTNAVMHPIKTATGMPDAIRDRIKEVAGDIHPIQAFDALKKGDLTEAAGQMLPVGEMYKNPVGLAADIAAVGSVGKMARASAELPTAMRQRNLASRVDRYMPNKSASGSAMGGSRILEDAGKASTWVDRYMPNTSMSDASRVTFADPADRLIGASGFDKYMPNTSMKAEAGAEASAAGRTEPPGRPPAYSGTERRSPNRVQGAAEDAAYTRMREKQNAGAPPESHPGGRQVDTPPQPKPDAINEGPKSSFPPEGGQGDWHAYESDTERKGADPKERSQAASLHRETSAMDDRYDYLSDPDNPHSAFGGPEALFAGLARDLVREQIRKIRGQTMNTGPVRKGLIIGREAAKTGIAGGNIVRSGSDR